MKFKDKNYKCFVIHLKRAKKRKAFVGKILENIYLKTEIIDAVNGTHLCKEEIDKITSIEPVFRPKYPFKLNSGEIGCFLSHKKAWQKIVDDKLSAGLIIEDDVKVDPVIFNNILEFSLKHIKDYEYIQLQVRKKTKVKNILKSENDVHLIQPTPTLLTTSAQIVSYGAAVKLLEITKKIDRPIDTTLQLFWQTNVRLASINQTGLSDHTLEVGGSTISEEKAFIYNISREFYRFFYRLNIYVYSKYKKYKETII
mgnify:CR=1 FL=1